MCKNWIKIINYILDGKINNDITNNIEYISTNIAAKKYDLIWFESK